MSIKHRMEAWKWLWRRYSENVKHFWKLRREITLPTLESHEAEFLPAALSIQAAPVSPVGRWVARILMLLIFTLLFWSVFGHLDIIVIGQGKIIPSGYTKTIASVEVARVSALHVTEGQSVTAGDLLIELDTRSSEADRDKADGDRQSAQLQAARSRALLLAINSGQVPRLVMPEELGEVRWRDATLHLEDQWRDYRAKLERLNSEIRRYAEALLLVTQKARDYENLASSNDVSQHAYLEKEQERIDLAGKLADARNQKTALIAETRKNAQDTLNEANRAMAGASQDMRRAVVHGDVLKLVAPVDGTVQQLTVHTVGGVVPAAQPLMQIVPRGASVEMEAFIENRDVGFVQQGHRAQVKIDAFEYTKYGTTTALVSHVSHDAIQDEKRGLIYSVKVALDHATMFVNDSELPLTPGMSGSVEIKTGERRVIEYVLSPLIQHVRESLRER